MHGYWFSDSIFRSLMNCVNSISQMNSCEHSSLIPPEKKPEKPPGPEGNGQSFIFHRHIKEFYYVLIHFKGDSKEYPPLLQPTANGNVHPESCPSSPRSRSPQSIRSTSQMSDYSGRHHSPDRLMSRLVTTMRTQPKKWNTYVKRLYDIPIYEATIQ